MFDRIRWTIILVAIIYTLSVEANYPPPERLTGMNPCLSKQTCHECIQTPSCAWCAMPVSILILHFCHTKLVITYLNILFFDTTHFNLFNREQRKIKKSIF